MFGNRPKEAFPILTWIFTSSSIINLLVVHINDGTFPLTYGSEIFTEDGLQCHCDSAYFNATFQLNQVNQNKHSDNICIKDIFNQGWFQQAVRYVCQEIQIEKDRVMIKG